MQNILTHPQNMAALLTELRTAGLTVTPGDGNGVLQVKGKSSVLDRYQRTITESKAALLAHFAAQEPEPRQVEVEPSATADHPERTGQPPLPAIPPPPERPADLPSFCAGYDCRHFRVYRFSGRPIELYCHWWIFPDNNARLMDWVNDDVRNLARGKMQCPETYYRNHGRK